MNKEVTNINTNTNTTTINSITNHLNTIKDLVEHTLEYYPETRANDTTLYLKCCEELGAKDLKDLHIMDLSIISVHKMRQVIQNKEGRFKADVNVQMARHRRASDIKDYMVN